MKLRSLKIRVMLWFGGLVAPILLLFSLGLYYSFDQSFHIKQQNRLHTLALQLVEKELLRALQSGRFDARSLRGVAVALLQDKRLPAQSDNFRTEDLRRFRRHPHNSYFVIDHEETLDLFYRYPIQQPVRGTLLLVDRGINNEVEDLVDTLLVLDPLLLLGLLIAAYIATEKILRPIRSASSMAARTSVTSLPHPLPLPKADDEIRELIVAFNTMVERLDRGIEEMERFNSDVSHELRTPLTVLQGEVDIALRKERDAASLRQTLQTVSEEIHTLRELVENLLFLSRHTPESVRESFQSVAADQILLETLQRIDPMFKKKKLKLSIETLEPCEIRSTPALLRTLFANLLDNAVKYTPEGKGIILSLDCRNGRLRFRIADEGIGIPSDQLAKLTERFYRVDEARSRKIPGFGLGLAIVNKIVDLHRGQLEIHSEESRGTTVEVTL